MGLLKEFSIIFGWLFVFVLSYALLEVTKVLGENKGLHAVLAVCFATLFAFSERATNIVLGSAPWFVVFMVLVMFLLIGVRFAFGDKGDELLLETLGRRKAGWWILLPVVAIVGILIAFQIGPEMLPGGGGTETTESGGTSTATSSFSQNIVNTLYHPKIIGMAAILMIAVFAIFTICTVPVKFD